MPVDFLVLSAALLAGLTGGAHCALMCGGIAASLNGHDKESALPHALALNLGRIGSYTLAGLLAGLLGAAFVGLVRIPDLALWLRSVMGLLLMLIALRMLFPRRFAIANALASPLWRLVSKAKATLPASGLWRSLGLGAIWGWLPCGLSTSVLLAAWMEASPLHSSLMMAAFGLGTLPLMTAMSYSGARLQGLLDNRRLRAGMALLVLSAGALTAAAPWLMRVPEMHGVLAALGCRSLA